MYPVVTSASYRRTYLGGWYQFFGRGKSGDDRAPHARDLSARFNPIQTGGGGGGFSIPPSGKNRDNFYTERAMTFKFSDFS